MLWSQLYVGMIHSVDEQRYREKMDQTFAMGVRLVEEIEKAKEEGRLMPVKKVLIAGATGYLGKFLLKECRQRGYWVRALARSTEKLDDVRDCVDDVFVGEATKPDTLQGLCEGIDVVISALGVASSRTK